MHTWTFRTRLRRAAFGWKGSRLAIERIHEALAEIRAVARRDPIVAAEGAVLFLERLSPALSHVDSSTGALGNATYVAVQDLVPLIRSAPVDTAMRRKWLDRLFEAIEEDDPPYIESLGDQWGELCATPELASSWADRLLPTQRNVLRERKRGTYAYFAGTTLCYSALFKAGRHDELLELLTMDPRPIWASPCDPKTLTRAARDHLVRQPEFAMQAALAALHWISTAHGHELTALDVMETHRLATEAARSTQRIDQAQALIEQALAPDRPMSVWMRRSLGLAQTSPSPQRQ